MAWTSRYNFLLLIKLNVCLIIYNLINIRITIHNCVYAIET